MPEGYPEAGPPPEELPKGPRREQAIWLLARGYTVGQVFQWVGCCRRALYNWRQEPEFAARVKAQRDANVKEAAELLRAATIRAARTVVQLSDRGGPEDKVRLASAEAVLTRAGLSADHRLRKQLVAAKREQAKGGSQLLEVLSGIHLPADPPQEVPLD